MIGLGSDKKQKRPTRQKFFRHPTMGAPSVSYTLSVSLEKKAKKPQKPLKPIKPNIPVIIFQKQPEIEEIKETRKLYDHFFCYIMRTSSPTLLTMVFSSNSSLQYFTLVLYCSLRFVCNFRSIRYLWCFSLEFHFCTKSARDLRVIWKRPVHQ